MTIQEMEQRIIKKFPDAEFEIIKPMDVFFTLSRSNV